MKNAILKISSVRGLFFVLLSIAIVFAACSKLLVEDPKDQVFIDNFFETENDAISAVNSIYAILNSTSTAPTFGGVYHSSYFIVQGLTSDEMENRLVGATDLNEMDQFKHKPVNATARDFWSNAYKAIGNANFALEGIPKVPMNETRKNQLLGEAHFLRGMLYFDLTRMFGDIPLVLSLTDPVYPNKATRADVYTQIIADLGFGEQNLPASYTPGNGLGRATSGAAKGLLAKVYLTQGNYAQAAANCKAIIDSGVYSLWDKFDDAFKIVNANGKENLFSIGFGVAGNSITFWEVGQFNVRLLPKELSGEIPGVNAQGWQVANQNLYNSFDPQDRRRAATFITEIHNTNGSTKTVDPHIQKYWDKTLEPMGGNTENDFQYLRYSDILLMYAEALNEQNGGPTAAAYEAINAVRKRARYDGTNELPILPDLSGLSHDAFKDALLNERRHEFVAEGQRWFDLVRFNKLVESVTAAKSYATPQQFHVLFPIPQEELDLNNKLYPQNPGY